MNIGDNIIDFQAADTAACTSCGAPKQTTLVCQKCAVHLVDLALSSLAEGVFNTLEETVGCGNGLRPAERRYYDHYEVCQSPDGSLAELGRGAMGITYKAMDMHLGCPVALKIINTHSLEGSAARARLLREARAAAQLRHPNIASIYHLGLADEHCYYSMEYIEGCTLEAFVHRSGVLSIEFALDIVSQAAQGLRVAHEQHFVHRDIKPSNLMLVAGNGINDPTVKIIDFGLVKAVADESMSKDLGDSQYFAGTPHYASPEQLNVGKVDARSDIYSLGACLWYMLAGRLPAQIDRSPIERPWETGSFDGLPPPVLSLLRLMLSPNPAHRPQSAAELLRRIQESRVASIAVASEGAGMRGRRHWWRFPVAGGMILTVLTAFIGLTHGNFMSNEQPKQVSPATDGGIDKEAKLLYDQAQEASFPATKARISRAIDLYRRAIARAPEFSDAHAGLAIACFKDMARFGGSREQIEPAIAGAERAIELDPHNPRGYHALGALRSIQGRLWDALTDVHKALEVDPKYLPAMREIGNLWMTVGQPQFALPWAKAAAELDPTMTGSWSLAADAYLDLGMDQEAETCYQRALQISPTWMTSHCGLMHLYLLEGDYARANQEYEVARSIDADSLLPLHLKAQVELFSGHAFEAEGLFRQLLARMRTGYVSYYGGMSYLSALGYLCRQAGNQIEGDAFLREAAELHVSSEGPAGIYDLAAIRAIEGRKADAFALLRQAVAAGWVDYRSLHLDPRFTTISREVQFAELQEELRRRVETMRVESLQRCAKPLRISDYPVSPSVR